MDIQTVSGYAEADVQALAVPVFKDEKADEGLLKELDEMTGGVVRAVLESEELKGKEGETAYIHLSGTEMGNGRRLLLVGAGERDDYQLGQIAKAAGTAVRFLRARSVKSVGIIPRAPEGTEAERAASSAVEGALMGLFEPDKYRTVD
ncbi:MAG TPA: M17 family peptidase N-terminal domain-containing protein, partial [Pyrinomonadaceae bacterium]|nr:M17 family peptidase N-terminal domain-containing protein [Pyrinomonadaceae bacterium]